MLDSEEVDDDYFTPMAKTSLASIFKKPLTEEQTDNETLKYTPPVPKPVQTHKEPLKRPYDTVFSCVFDAYLWLDNVYTSKGRLGCAIVKHNTAEGAPSFHSILLYDSNKATVSSAIATKELEVTVKGNNVISYYDRYEKYWCLNGSENDIKRIIDVLKTCNVNIKVLNNDDSAPQQNKDKEFTKMDTNKKYIESDTDSSTNRKTKASILSRMATMGQSVLPPRTASNEQSSDSSDTNVFDSQVVAVRHKPAKNTAKKSVADKNISELHVKADVHKKIIPSTAQKKDIKTVVALDNQIMPLQNTVSIASSSSHDLNYFFTEQRIANSELRINMTRVSDKVDNILNKVNNLEKSKNEESAINTEIFQKLLKEYESKIKTYEELLQNVNKNNSSISRQDLTANVVENNENIELNNTITELNNCIKQKDAEISALINEIKKLKEVRANHTEDQLEGRIFEYKEALDKNKEILQNLTIENDELLKSHNVKIEQKIKSIINDTFRAIEINFDENESYSGGEIKNIIATVIKSVTIESLNKGK